MKKYVLFDFDGVILDSFAPAYEASCEMCKNMNEETYRGYFEGNINEAQNKCSGEDCNHDADFVEIYLPKLREQSTVFEGMPEVLKSLSEKYNLIIISSTLTAPIKEILEKENLAQYFTEIMGNDVHKSKVEKIKMVFDKYKINSTDCVFITDTLGDIKEAAHMNVRAIAVNWGFNHREVLEKGSPIKIVDTPKEMENTVDEYFGMI